MLSLADWIKSQVAEDGEALAAGDGCHYEEAKALGDYLSDILGTQEAAKKIVSPVLQEEDPPSTLYRLWGLLTEALVELWNERQKTLDLLAAIQSLPATTKIDWSKLPGFRDMWNDSYQLHLHGPSGWEKESWTEVRKAELCHHFTAVGKAEADMFLRGLGEVPAEWGYQVLNLVCSRRTGLDVFIFEVHAWLETAGAQLRQSVEAEAEETKGYLRPVMGARYGSQKSISCRMGKHWETWKRELLELSGSKSRLSLESRDLAARCFRLM